MLAEGEVGNGTMASRLTDKTRVSPGAIGAMMSLGGGGKPGPRASLRLEL